MPAAIAGQYITVRVTGAGQPAPVRSYSLSSAPGDGTYRISVKREPNGAASTYLTKELRPGSTLEVAAARGESRWIPAPMPSCSSRLELASRRSWPCCNKWRRNESDRDTWWIDGARRPEDDALAERGPALLAAMPKSHGMIFYSGATPQEPLPAHGSPGRITKDKLSQLALPADAAAYICGPSGFMTDIQEALTALGIDPSRIRTELFGALASVNPGVVGQARRPPHPPAARPVPVRSSLSPGAASQHRSAPASRACSTWPTPATSAPGGVVAPACATPVRRRCWPARPPTVPTRSNSPPREKSLSAAPGPRPKWSSTCKPRPLVTREAWL